MKMQPSLLFEGAVNANIGVFFKKYEKLLFDNAGKLDIFLEMHRFEQGCRNWQGIMGCSLQRISKQHVV